MTTSNTSPVRLTDQAKRWITKALKEDHAQSGERVIWEVSLVVFPDYAATDNGLDATVSPLPTLTIYLEIPSVKPDSTVYLSTIVPPSQLSYKTVEKVVTHALTTLRDHRKSLLDKPEADA